MGLSGVHGPDLGPWDFESLFGGSVIVVWDRMASF